MKTLGRVIDWSDFIQAMDETRGTAIVERYSPAGDVTLWWTPENIYEVCPYSPVDWEGLRDKSFLPFAEWCRKRYSSPEVGRALLVGPSPKGEPSSLRFRFECGDPSPTARWIEVVSRRGRAEEKVVGVNSIALTETAKLVPETR